MQRPLTTGGITAGGTSIAGGNVRGGAGGPGGSRTGGAGGVGGGGGSLAEKQQALASLYNQIAEEGVEIGGGVESAARRALKGSGIEPAKPITVAREEGAGGQLGGGAMGRGGPGGGMAGGPMGGPGGGPGGQNGPGGMPGGMQPQPQLADAGGDLGAPGGDDMMPPQQMV